MVPQTVKFTIDCQQPADDNIIEPKDVGGHELSSEKPSTVDEFDHFVC